MAVTKTETAIVASIVGIAAFVVIGLIQSAIAENRSRNEKAQALGFIDAAEMDAAKKDGMVDPIQWRAQVASDQQAKKKSEQERINKAEQAAKEEAVRRAKANAEMAERNRPATDRMTLSAQSWEKGGFGSIGIMSMTISNMNPFAVKDITIRCTFDGKSGTQLTERLQTIYDTIPANNSKRFAKVNVGFIDSQSARAGCSLVMAGRL